MTRKQIGQNTGLFGRFNLSGPKPGRFEGDVGGVIEVDVTESKAIAKVIIDNSDHRFYYCVETSRLYGGGLQ